MRTKPGENDPSFKVSNDKRVRMYMNLYTSEMVSKYQRYCYTYSNHSASTFRSKPPVFHQVSIDRTIFENTRIATYSYPWTMMRLGSLYLETNIGPAVQLSSSCSCLLHLPTLCTRACMRLPVRRLIRNVFEIRKLARVFFTSIHVLYWNERGRGVASPRITYTPSLSLSLSRSLAHLEQRERERETII